jgi:hypothetical protein
MIKRHLALQTAQAAENTSDEPSNPLAPGYWSRHPGTVESLVPVWGSAREAVADYHDGDMGGAALNGAMAAADLTGEGLVLRDLWKGGAKVAGSNTWNATRKWMGKKGLLDEGQHGHHWLIPKRSDLPDRLKNQPWNIKGMPSPEVHGRIHGPYSGQPQFNPLQQLWYGTPAWAKTQAGLAAGHVAQGAVNGLDDPAGATP